MKIRFVPADQLKAQYTVLGHFYTLELPDAGPKPSRSVLEIRSKSAPWNDEPDAVFVMMNPGSSKPLTQAASLREGDCGSSPGKVLVPASPDTTQYQVMRVMHEQGWIYVRVINLSDLIDTQSGSFVRCFPEVETATGNFIHSIFAPERAEELARKLRRVQGAPVLGAGVYESVTKRLLSPALCVRRPTLTDTWSRQTRWGCGPGLRGVSITPDDGDFLSNILIRSYFPYLPAMPARWNGA